MLPEKFKAGKRNTKTIKFPGTDQDIIITVLSEAELQDAALATEKLFKFSGIEINPRTLDIYESEKTTQILYRALRDPEDSGPIASNIKEFRSLLTTDEKDILVEEYLSFKIECSLNIDTTSKKESHITGGFKNDE